MSEGTGAKPRRKAGRRAGRVETVDRYRTENADGSITWGYNNEDGSFKVYCSFTTRDGNKHFPGWKRPLLFL